MLRIKSIYNIHDICYKLCNKLYINTKRTEEEKKRSINPLFIVLNSTPKYNK